MRSVGVVTVARSDYGIYRPLLKRIQGDSELSLRLLVSGMHLSPEFGLTANAIEEDGFEISEKVESLLSSDTPEGIAKSMGLGTIGFAQAYSRFRPDILLTLGDRFEMHAAVVAALPFRIPVAHIHGGESTEGLIDEQIRHSITKMSHLHFVSTEFYGQRVVQMGEEPWRVTVSGAPGLDNLRDLRYLTRDELESQFGLDLSGPTVVATYHPVTLEYENTEAQVGELLQALRAAAVNVVFTYPNADTASRGIIETVREFTSRESGCKLVVSLGQRAYFSLLSQVVAMVGNSSSGIIEAASFELPVVNIGDRQKGRLHGANVIDVGSTRGEISEGISKALSKEFKAGLAHLENPYGNGCASDSIIDRLKAVDIGPRLLMKSFYSPN